MALWLYREARKRRRSNKSPPTEVMNGLARRPVAERINEHKKEPDQQDLEAGRRSHARRKARPRPRRPRRSPRSTSPRSLRSRRTLRSLPHPPRNHPCQPGRKSPKHATAAKKAVVLSLLRREGDATLDEIAQAPTGQLHAIRGFLSIASKIESTKPEGGKRIYRIVS